MQMNKREFAKLYRELYEGDYTLPEALKDIEIFLTTVEEGIKKDISIDCLFLLFYLNCLMIWHSDICPLTDLIFSHSYSIHFLSFQQPSNSKMYYLLYF